MIKYKFKKIWQTDLRSQKEKDWAGRLGGIYLKLLLPSLPMPANLSSYYGFRT